MIDPELQALLLSGPAGIAAVLGASLLAAVCALSALVRASRMQRLMAAEFAALNGRLAAAEAEARARVETLCATIPPPVPVPAPSAPDADAVAALAEAVRSAATAVARIDRQLGDVRLQIRTLQADTGTRMDQLTGEIQAALSGYERLAVDVMAKALAAVPAAQDASLAAPAPPAGAGRGGDETVPRERVPEPFRRPVPRPVG
ncbi:hypothetical protein M2352_005085 [Azospirillum fermentarium]|uniref:hypothetical protein n=1 Tax=Azospirillum fermentarium TaxID=1233114 RepID=UPI002227EDDB|nr:hypothetical protein [Azospirillum fermentarium]MCW2249425.1 hypothetical protein [Azospirillum fermentarium]